MPRPNVVAVVALTTITSRRTEIIEVARRPGVSAIAIRAARGKVLVISHHGSGDRFDPPPARIIRLQESLVSPAIILIISQWEYRGVTRVYQQVRRVFLPTGVCAPIAIVKVSITGVTCNISRCRNDRIRR